MKPTDSCDINSSNKTGSVLWAHFKKATTRALTPGWRVQSTEVLVDDPANLYHYET